MALIGVRSFRATKEENFGIQRKINQFEHDAIKGARIRIWEIITIFLKIRKFEKFKGKHRAEWMNIRLSLFFFYPNEWDFFLDILHYVIKQQKSL